MQGIKFRKDKLHSKTSFFNCPVYFDAKYKIYWNDLPNININEFYSGKYWNDWKRSPRLNIINFLLKISNTLDARNYSNFLMLKKYMKKENPKILEIGFGIGDFLVYLFKNGYSIKGIDMDPQNVEWVSKMTNKNIIIKGNYETTALNEKFDAIYLKHVLEHFLDIGAVVKKLYKDLNKDGIVYFSAPNAMHKQFLNQSIHKEPHVYHFTSEGLEKIFIENGFKKILTGSYGYEPEKFNFKYYIKTFLRKNIIKKGLKEKNLIGIFTKNK